jgi:hypothetical protein
MLHSLDQRPRFYFLGRPMPQPDPTHERSARLWKRSLSDALPLDAMTKSFRNVTLEDIPELGALFFSAFAGTIDDAGHTEAQHTAKAAAILNGRYGRWISEASFTIEKMGKLHSACLVSDYKPYGCPVIAVVATVPGIQRSGDGGRLLDAALRSLAILGHQECCSMITVGNIASERLFTSRKFRSLQSNETFAVHWSSTVG